MSNVNIIPKRERSPTPPLVSSPKTSGSWLVTPMPEDCQKSNPRWQEARRTWLSSEVTRFRELGLKVQKAFVRDDGLVIDWTSVRPVWPDSLQPVYPPENLGNGEVGSSVMSHNTIFQPVVDTFDKQGVRYTREEEIEYLAMELEERAIDFLARFAKAFDTNRNSLSGAYAKNALFSYCIHDIITLNSATAAFALSAEIQRFAHRSQSRNLLKSNTSKNLFNGPSEILNMIKSLGPHGFSSILSKELPYNVLPLKIGSKPCVFLSTHGYLSDLRDNTEKSISFDQCFILMREEDTEIDDNLRDSSNLWPLDKYIAVNMYRPYVCLLHVPVSLHTCFP
ncbi:hypothetical protein PNOK_0492400 [Pyrrhoderma noxium]|uniref:Nuclear transport factor 2 domain-containing protein n=1 Tax=Pyrrhoderma noxium TaxID=2282107 RepID=A0A286UK89_9AGAM|nr:hypothetical protein PNOK_0492400 [Pyrrhoderma noxium]